MTRERGQPIPNATVTLTHQAVANTGGHWHHDNARPAGSFTPASGNTDATGWLDVTYTAPQVSGDIAVTATCTSTSGACPPENKTAEVQFCCLQIVDVGAWIGIRPIHPGSHWGSADLASRLAQVETDYEALYPGSTLEVNDVSLEWGGLFDIDANWVPDHVGHRWGDNVDLRLVPRQRREQLRLLCRNAGLRVLEEVAPPHWHLSVR